MSQPEKPEKPQRKQRGPVARVLTGVLIAVGAVIVLIYGYFFLTR